jgi:hypothetical protein
MEIVGKITQVLPLEKGVSKTSGKEWQMQAYVLETLENYPKKVHFEVFGEERIKANQCNIDDVVTVSFDIESREFNTRWYTSIRAWKIVANDSSKVDEVVEPAISIVNNQVEVDALVNMPNANVYNEAAEIENNIDLPF